MRWLQNGWFSAKLLRRVAPPGPRVRTGRRDGDEWHRRFNHRRVEQPRQRCEVAAAPVRAGQQCNRPAALTSCSAAGGAAGAALPPHSRQLCHGWCLGLQWAGGQHHADTHGEESCRRSARTIADDVEAERDQDCAVQHAAEDLGPLHLQQGKRSRKTLPYRRNTVEARRKGSALPRMCTAP